MDKTSKFTLKLTGDGMMIEREVTPEVAHAIVGLILGGSVAPTTTIAQPAALNPAAVGAAPALSVREFLEAHTAKRIPEQIACIALYLKKQHNATVFTKKELVKGFEDAQEPVPSNLHRDIAWATKNGWIAPKTGTKNSFYLTGTGENAVTTKFPAEVRKKTKQVLRPRKKRKATAQAKP